ncbi:MAG: 30S ribosomal protein S20 [Nitrospiria bacterium]
MANHPSALKRERQARKRRLRNRSVSSAVKTSIKKVEAALAEKETEAVAATLKAATSSLDRAASKGVIPKGRAARKISRLTAKANELLLPAL